jgi:hypothetical protein
MISQMSRSFLELEREKYLCTKSVSGIGAILVETQMWETRLENSGILNLMEIPHFGRSLEINACVKLLLSLHPWRNIVACPTSID